MSASGSIGLASGCFSSKTVFTDFPFSSIWWRLRKLELLDWDKSRRADRTLPFSINVENLLASLALFCSVDIPEQDIVERCLWIDLPSVSNSLRSAFSHSTNLRCKTGYVDRCSIRLLDHGNLDRDSKADPIAKSLKSWAKLGNKSLAKGSWRELEQIRSPLYNLAVSIIYNLGQSFATDTVPNAFEEDKCGSSGVWCDNSGFSPFRGNS